jgi:hypothetical protein
VDGDEDAPVKPRVARPERPIADFTIEMHAADYATGRGLTLAVFGPE